MVWGGVFYLGFHALFSDLLLRCGFAEYPCLIWGLALKWEASFLLVELSWVYVYGGGKRREAEREGERCLGVRTHVTLDGSRC